MTTIRVITTSEFKSEFQSKMGSLMFPSDYYDCKHHVDYLKLKSNLWGSDLIEHRQRILRVLITTTNHSGFKNVSNLEIPYKKPVCADEKTTGAYRKHYPEMNFTSWVSDYPVGDAVIVVSE